MFFSLLHFFLAKNSEKYKESKRLSIELLTRLINYSWPGNIRELENLMERLFVISSGSVLEEKDLPDDFLINIAEDRPNSDVSLQSGENLPKPRESVLNPPTLKELLEEEEKRIILEKYKHLRSSYKVAKELGISQSQAFQKIKKYKAGN